jgi:hypothetical protein
VGHRFSFRYAQISERRRSGVTDGDSTLSDAARARLLRCINEIPAKQLLRLDLDAMRVADAFRTELGFARVVFRRRRHRHEYS